MIFKFTRPHSTKPAFYFSYCWERWVDESAVGKLLIVYRQLMLRGCITTAVLMDHIDIDRDIKLDGTAYWKIYLYYPGGWRQFMHVTPLFVRNS